jgi:hypothetical protein
LFRSGSSTRGDFYLQDRGCEVVIAPLPTGQADDRANVVALPHAGASTHEGLDRTNLVAYRCVVAILDGDMPPAGCTVADGRLSRPAFAGEPPDRP